MHTTKTNIYWPVYKNLESGVLNLAYSIHFDDSQLEVYSPFISDLILRASAEIESISKELYKQYGGAKTEKIKYDSDALEYLNNKWKLEEKVVIISSPSCYQSNKELFPFKKNEISNHHGGITFSWNNAYQNLKHDRGNSIKFGSIKYLFDIMAALYILNIYLKNESFNLGKDKKPTNFSSNLASDLFAVKVHHFISQTSENYNKNSDFDECIYLIKHTDQTQDIIKVLTFGIDQYIEEYFKMDPRYIMYCQNNNPHDYKGDNLMLEVLGKNGYNDLMQIKHQKLIRDRRLQYFFEATLNKNEL